VPRSRLTEDRQLVDWLFAETLPLAEELDQACWLMIQGRDSTFRSYFMLPTLLAVCIGYITITSSKFSRILIFVLSANHGGFSSIDFM
jgi:hypothetical protein